MTKQDKIEFINTFLNNIRDRAILKVDEMPESWDGFELRWYFADKFNFEQIGRLQQKARYREFKNALATTNL